MDGVTTRYVNDIAAPLPQVLAENKAGTQTAYLYGAGLAAVYDSGNWAYQHPDALGSVRQQTDSAGLVTVARGYTPFGKTLWQAGDPGGSFGFAGEQNDPASGLTFLRSRYYDPSTGRFLTKDTYPALAPVPQSLHRYAYVGNDPVNRVDPSGERYWEKPEDAYYYDEYGIRVEKAIPTLWFSEEVTSKRVEYQKNAREEYRQKSAKLEQNTFYYDQLQSAGPPDPRNLIDFPSDNGESASPGGYLDYKIAGLTPEWRQVINALERGDFSEYMLEAGDLIYKATGLNNIVNSITSQANMTYRSWRRNMSIVTNPRFIGSKSWSNAMGGAALDAANFLTFGGAYDTYYGAKEGDWLRASSGALQTLSFAGTLVGLPTAPLALAGNALDMAVAGREVYRGIETGNYEQIEAGMYGIAFNSGQLRTDVGKLTTNLRRGGVAAATSFILAGDELGDALARNVGAFDDRVLPVRWNEKSQRWHAAADFEFQGQTYQRGRFVPTELGDYARQTPVGIPPERAIVPYDPHLAARQLNFPDRVTNAIFENLETGQQIGISLKQLDDVTLAMKPASRYFDDIYPYKPGSIGLKSKTGGFVTDPITGQVLFISDPDLEVIIRDGRILTNREAMGVADSMNYSARGGRDASGPNLPEYHGYKVEPNDPFQHPHRANYFEIEADMR
ncbi:MAG: RHS repeat-associated core domain-containing protein, partial [Chloroflexi bacterium]|nr:RHS repeat-associated core domain-containing protein [Chloroflexota bacterium]